MISTISPYLDAALPWLFYAALLATILAGLFINILGLPGLWLIVIAAIAYAWCFQFAFVGWWTIGVLVILGLLAELVEFLAAAAGSKRAGGSKRGMAGAVLGGLVGGLLGTVVLPVPVLGTIIGSVIGCFVGTYPIEYAVGRSHREAAVIGFGAAKGRVYGLLAKTGFGVVMGVVAAVMAAPIGPGVATTQPAPLEVPATLPTSADATSASSTS